MMYVVDDDRTVVLVTMFDIVSGWVGDDDGHDDGGDYVDDDDDDDNGDGNDDEAIITITVSFCDGDCDDWSPCGDSDVAMAALMALIFNMRMLVIGWQRSTHTVWFFYC